MEADRRYSGGLTHDRVFDPRLSGGMSARSFLSTFRTAHSYGPPRHRQLAALSSYDVGFEGLKGVGPPHLNVSPKNYRRRQGHVSSNDSRITPTIRRDS